MKLKLTKLLAKQYHQEKLAQQVEAKIVNRLMENLKPVEIVTLGQMLDADDSSLEDYLKNRCPDFDKIVDEEINRADIIH